MASSPPANSLNVIALVSGGKDSFFSALHCLENGHRLVALANLHPPPATPTLPEPASSSEPRDVAEKVTSRRNNTPAANSAEELRPGLAGLALDRPSSTACPNGASRARPGCGEAETEAEAEEETDLNSFMYQTVGHQVIPLYAEATGIPLYRRPIVGGAVQSGRDYSAARDGGVGTEEDETESMVPLLRSIIARHPEVNALSAGAILSTYQRTRVESVALRLGLTPLAYLWKYPIHPPPSPAGVKDEAQLLFDMAAAGLDARIIKVASGGLDESFLWENVASAKGVTRLKRAMGRFGSAGTDTGAVLGEGGEFETLVVDGPRRLFKKRIAVDEEDRVVVREGGGTAWSKVTNARIEEKTTTSGDEDLNVRRPDLLDPRFTAVLAAARPGLEDMNEDSRFLNKSEAHITIHPTSNASIQTWAVVRSETTNNLTIKEETTLLIDEIRTLLTNQNLNPTSILSTAIILRSMSDFPAINTVYGSLFTEPNPPSRVTISCGDLLPSSSGNIAIYLTVHAGQADRQGLHVQSRSYWAPANIGPYSQAITFPAAADASGEPGVARVVHIAGQIPLVPASMELPVEGIDMQVALSLQHLWRVGAEMGVQWWTSGAVYFPRSSSSSALLPPRDRALVAYNAWREAHRWSSSGDGNDDDGDESGPDLWDRKFNPMYMTYAGDGGEAQRKPGSLLPDYSLLHPLEDEEPVEDGEEKEGTQDPKSRYVPFFLAAEVDELPRSAAAEWHAHAGLCGLVSGPGGLSVRVSREKRPEAAIEVEHCVLVAAPQTSAGAGAGGLLHSVVAVGAAGPTGASSSLGEQVREMSSRLSGDSAAAKGEFSSSLLSFSYLRPYLVYADTAVFAPDQVTRAIRDDGLAVVPCASIWGGSGLARLAMVALYRTPLS